MRRGSRRRRRSWRTGASDPSSPNLRDLERSYLVADLGGCRYGAVDVLAPWCCPARRRRRSRRSIDAQTVITLPTSLGLSSYIFSAPYGVSAGHESFSGPTGVSRGSRLFPGAPPREVGVWGRRTAQWGPAAGGTAGKGPGGRPGV